MISFETFVSVFEWLLIVLTKTIYEIINILNTMMAVLIYILQWISKAFLILIFLTASTAIIHYLEPAMQWHLLPENNWVLLSSSLFDKPWVAVTALIATSVAFAHFRTLELNLDKHAIERQEKDKQEREKELELQKNIMRKV